MQVKFRIPEIVLGALLAVALIAIGFVFGSSRNSNLATDNPSPNKTSNEKNNGGQAERGWITSDNLLALFTLGLVVVGGFQLRFFLVQLRLMNKGVVDAAIAAEAARKSADTAEKAFTQLERPWVFVELLLNLYGSADDAFEEPYALFDIVNHGRTPATIELAHIGITSGELSPEIPILTDEFHGVIGPGKSMEKCKAHCPSGYTYELAVEIGGDQYPVPIDPSGWFVFFYAFIRYRDVADQTHVSSFCWRYDRGVSRWVEFEDTDPASKKFNYKT